MEIEVRIRQRSQAKTCLEKLNNMIEKYDGFQYDHAAIFLKSQNIKFALEQLKKSLKNKMDKDKYDKLMKKYIELKKIYGKIRGEELI